MNLLLRDLQCLLWVVKPSIPTTLRELPAVVVVAQGLQLHQVSRSLAQVHCL